MTRLTVVFLSKLLGFSLGLSLSRDRFLGVPEEPLHPCDDRRLGTLRVDLDEVDATLVPVEVAVERHGLDVDRLALVATVVRYETRAALRDRNTVLYSLIVPLFLYPALIWAFAQWSMTYSVLAFS